MPDMTIEEAREEIERLRSALDDAAAELDYARGCCRDAFTACEDGLKEARTALGGTP